MPTYLLMFLGILLSAFAQLGLKRMARFEMWTYSWVMGIGICVGLYGLAFLLYSYILRHYRVTVAGPIMMIGVVGVVALGGILMGETLQLRQWLGLLLALIAVWLLLG
jgi:drug/metabolite transporter (DMT)-like permease